MKGFPGGAPIDQAALLTLECDYLVPAALENQITVENAADVRARIIVEGANGPTTHGADAILEDRGSSSSPTSSRTAAASRFPTSSGSRTAWASSGASRK